MGNFLHQAEPEDFVIATGVTTMVRDFIRMAFLEAGITLEFTGKGIEEKAVVVSCAHEDFSIEPGKVVVAVDPAYFRPTEVDLLIGDATKAQQKLGWYPSYDLEALVKEMVEYDILEFERVGKVQLEHLL